MPLLSSSEPVGARVAWRCRSISPTSGVAPLPGDLATRTPLRRPALPADFVIRVLSAETCRYRARQANPVAAHHPISSGGPVCHSCLSNDSRPRFSKKVPFPLTVTINVVPGDDDEGDQFVATPSQRPGVSSYPGDLLDDAVARLIAEIDQAEPLSTGFRRRPDAVRVRRPTCGCLSIPRDRTEPEGCRRGSCGRPFA